MATRRRFIQSLGIISAVTMFCGPKELWAMSNNKAWFMPDESAPHLRTWMAFGASRKIWGKKLLPEVQRNLATIALTIAKFEPVSMLVRQSDFAVAKQLMGDKVELIVCPLDDLWMRDIGPVFVLNDSGYEAAIDFNFNGWGKKQDFDVDAGVAAFVADNADVDLITTQLILEGGGIEVDGEGTAIITQSCVLNDNRNPALSKAQVEAELKRLLGLDKIIWLPGIKGRDITDGHTDFYARFARPGVVVAGFDPDVESFDHAVTTKNIEILRAATDAAGRKLDVVVLPAPQDIRETYANDDFAAGYINFYVCNGAVIAPEFGDVKADALAFNELQRLFPERQVVQINIDGIAAGGGGIHCTTQQQPSTTAISSKLDE
ncbi:agmatine deiminase family protein [Shewanella sp. SNU WT4]|uniref:agmatine deiminase family protein n=1 Tax=Shewanella sp. SNU WT4 TaxID=2590015 RepID=UPI00112B34E1|nr:agmatine deiminase family protein [Shewanella sp. SNU WT4]QDF66929.1 agmatine deiminase family protein [Shewanella sp. SNU WT4]